MKDLFIGISYIFKGFKLLRQKGIRRFVIIPLLINSLLFSIGISLSTHYVGELIEQWLPSWLTWLNWLIWPVFFLILMSITFFSFSVLANLVSSPFNTALAEAVEKYLRKQSHSQSEDKHLLPSASQIVTDLASGVQKFMYLSTRFFPIALLFFIPGMQLVTTVLGFGYAAWLLSFEYLDYPMSNSGISFSQQKPKLQNKKLVLFGFGVSCMTLILFPIFNFLVMPIAVAGATALWVEVLDQN